MKETYIEGTDQGEKDIRLRKQIRQRYKIPTFCWPGVIIATTAIILLTFF